MLGRLDFLYAVAPVAQAPTGIAAAEAPDITDCRKLRLCIAATLLNVRKFFRRIVFLSHYCGAGVKSVCGTRSAAQKKRRNESAAFLFAERGKRG